MNEQMKKQTKEQTNRNKSKGSMDWMEAGKVLASSLLYKRHRQLEKWWPAIVSHPS